MCMVCFILGVNLEYGLSLLLFLWAVKWAILVKGLIVEAAELLSLDDIKALGNINGAILCFYSNCKVLFPELLNEADGIAHCVKY